jgi:hypothetical protein
MTLLLDAKSSISQGACEVSRRIIHLPPVSLVNSLHQRALGKMTEEALVTRIRAMQETRGAYS